MARNVKTEKLPAARHVEMPPDEITIMDGRNDRTAFEGAPLLGLASSMESLGQLQEIILNETDHNRLELVAGERRLRAAINAKRNLVECKVYNGLTDLQVARVVRAENAERLDLNVIERAGSLERLAGLGMTDKDIAAEDGCSVDTVRRLRGLLKLSDVVQDMMIRSKCPLPTHQASLLLQLPEANRSRVAEAIAPVGGPVLGEAEVREMVRAQIGKPLPGMEEPPAKKPAKAKTPKAAKAGKADASGCPQAAACGGDGTMAAEKLVVPSVAETVRPVKVVISLAGKLRAGKSTRAVIKSAAVTVKVGDKVEVLPVAVDVQVCVGLAKAVEMAIVQQTKATGKKATGKKPAKKPAKGK